MNTKIEADFVDGHRGEYWYKCTDCGATDWFAHYSRPKDLNQCLSTCNKKDLKQPKKFDALVFVGRFQPFHRGHAAVVSAALEQAKEVIIVVGSSFSARSLHNPFTFDERREMIKAEFPMNNIKVVPVSDYPYSDNKWVSAVQHLVRGAMSYTPDPTRIGLIGHSKDSTSYYLNIFPGWGSVEVPNVSGISATYIRENMWNDLEASEVTDMTDASRNKLYEIVNRYPKEFRSLYDDFHTVKKYKDMWSTAPYDPTFITTDAVLVQNGKILLIERGESPFKGLWALPGGHLEQNITLEENMLKELKEETRVKVPEKVLRGSIKEQKVFDKPNRDPRGRYVTHAYYIDLGFPDTPLPKVKGESDAKTARWFDLGELKSEMMAFDHWHIIQYFLKG